MSFFERIQSIDRRWIYLVLAAVLIVSLILGRPETPVVIKPAQDLFNAVEQAPAGPGDGKLIIVGTVFAANTMGESGNQARAIFRHLFLRHKRFAIIAIGEPQGATLGPIIAEEVGKQYGAKYGVDWISFGYQINALTIYKSLLKDIPKTVVTDSLQDKPLSSFPIMKGIKSIQRDVPLEIEITASDSLDSWLLYVQPATEPRMKIGYACTGVMAATAYPLLDSGQLSGMAPGLKGAADYELLVDKLESDMIARGELLKREQYHISKDAMPGMTKSARQYMFTQSNAHLAILAFILLGNIGLLLARRKPRQVKEEESNG